MYVATQCPINSSGKVKVTIIEDLIEDVIDHMLKISPSNVLLFLGEVESILSTSIIHKDGHVGSNKSSSKSFEEIRTNAKTGLKSIIFTIEEAVRYIDFHLIDIKSNSFIKIKQMITASQSNPIEQIHEKIENDIKDDRPVPFVKVNITDKVVVSWPCEGDNSNFNESESINDKKKNSVNDDAENKNDDEVNSKCDGKVNNIGDIDKSDRSSNIKDTKSNSTVMTWKLTLLVYNEVMKTSL